MHEALVDPWYSNPTFVVPVLWIVFLSGILWATRRKLPLEPEDVGTRRPLGPAFSLKLDQHVLTRDRHLEDSHPLLRIVRGYSRLQVEGVRMPRANDLAVL